MLPKVILTSKSWGTHQHMGQQKKQTMRNSPNGWGGGVNHNPETDNSDFSWEDTASEEDTCDSDEPQSDVESDTEDKEEIIERLKKNMEHEAHLLKHVTTVYDKLTAQCTKKDWKRAESNRGLGYNGNSDCSQRHNNKKARDKEIIDKELRGS